jgi:hypothetical protein
MDCLKKDEQTILETGLLYKGEKMEYWCKTNQSKRPSAWRLRKVNEIVIKQLDGVNCTGIRIHANNMRLSLGTMSYLYVQRLSIDDFHLHTKKLQRTKSGTCNSSII